MDQITFMGNNSPDDVRWLFSLSESELDMLISLKKLALQRAEVVGHKSLAEKIDLKMLRALGFILMQYVKGQVSDLQLTGLVGSKDFLDGCNLLKLDLEDAGELVGNEDLMRHMEVDTKKRTNKRSSKITPDSKKQKKQ